MHNQIIVSLALLNYPPIKDFDIRSNPCYTYVVIYIHTKPMLGIINDFRVLSSIFFN